MNMIETKESFSSRLSYVVLECSSDLFCSPHSTKALRASGFEFRCCATSSYLVVLVNVGILLISTVGRLGLCPKTSCDGEKP